MWILASLPFWLLGTVLFAIPVLAVMENWRTETFMTFTEAKGAAILWLAAGIFFIFAAKVAS